MQTALRLPVTGCTAVKMHLCGFSCRKVVIHSGLISVLQLLLLNLAELGPMRALVLQCLAVSRVLRICLLKLQGRKVILLVQLM